MPLIFLLVCRWTCEFIIQKLLDWWSPQELCMNDKFIEHQHWHYWSHSASNVMDSFLDLSLETGSRRPFPETRCSLLGRPRLVKLSSVLSSDLDDTESSRGPSCWAKYLSAVLTLFKNLWEKTKLTSSPSHSRNRTVHVPSFLSLNRKALVCWHEHMSINIFQVYPAVRD